MSDELTTNTDYRPGEVDYEALTGERLAAAAAALSGAVSECEVEIRLRVWEPELAAFRAAQPLDLEDRRVAGSSLEAQLTSAKAVRA